MAMKTYNDLILSLQSRLNERLLNDIAIEIDGEVYSSKRFDFGLSLNENDEIVLKITSKWG